MIIRQLIGGGVWNPQNQYCFQIVNESKDVKIFLNGRSSSVVYQKASGWAGTKDDSSIVIYKEHV